MAIGSEEHIGAQAHEIPVSAGETVSVKSEQGIKRIIFGRSPLHTPEGEPNRNTKGTMLVKLLESSHFDTSRQQFMIEREEDKPFMLTNLSKTIEMKITTMFNPVKVLQPGEQMRLAYHTLEMQGLNIVWRRGPVERDFEVSVQGIGSNTGDKIWNVDYQWNIKPVTS